MGIELLFSMKELKQLDTTHNLFMFLLDGIVPKLKQRFALVESENIKDSEAMGCEFIIAAQNKVFLMSLSRDDLSIEEVPTPAAIGCGGQLALAAYKGILTVTEVYTEPKDIIKEDIIKALEIAADLNLYCDKNIDILKGGNL